MKIQFALAAIMLSSGFAMAQPVNRPSSVRILVGEWNYVPIFEYSGGTATVQSIAAISEEGTTFGDNLVAAWYVRDGASWIQKSWSEKDRWGIVEQIKGSLNISDEDDYRWGVARPSFFTPANPVKDVASGVLVTDPLAPVLQSLSDPAPLLDALVTVGYEAVKTPTDFSGAGCTADSMLGQIELAVAEQGALDDPRTLPVAESLAATGLKTCAGTVVVPISDKPQGPPTPWTLTECTPFQHGGCNWVQRCRYTRTQTYVRKRTKSCVIGGIMTFCDQMTVLTCSEPDYCQSSPAVPGVIDPAGRCWPPTTLPAAPTPPCGAHTPRVPIINPRSGDPSVPVNCDIGVGGWVPLDSTCACP